MLTWWYFFLCLFYKSEASVFNLEPAQREIARILKIDFIQSIPLSLSTSDTENEFESDDPSDSSCIYISSSDSETESEGSGNESNNIRCYDENIIRQYIESEISHYSFHKSAQVDQFRIVLNFIAKNDYYGYSRNLRTFRIVFLNEPFSMKRDGIPNYLSHYIVRFGAINFIDNLHPAKFSFQNLDLGGALEFLVHTKPLERVLQVFKSNIKFKMENIRRLSLAVQVEHPTLHYLDYLLFEMGSKSQIEPFLSTLFEARDESIKFKMLTEILEIKSKSITCKGVEQIRFIGIPARYPEYFLSLSIGIRQYFARLAIYNDYLEVFKHIFDLDNRLVLHWSSETTLLHFAVIHNRVEFVRYMMGIVPELSTVEINSMTSPFFLAVSLELIPVLECFESFGLTFERRTVRDRRSVNALQYSFLLRLPLSFSYFLTKMDLQAAINHLFAIFFNIEGILRHALTKNPVSKFSLARILVDRLRLDLFNTAYHDEFTGCCGNALIFVAESDLIDFQNEFGTGKPKIRQIK